MPAYMQVLSNYKEIKPCICMVEQSPFRSRALRALRISTKFDIPSLAKEKRSQKTYHL